MLVKIEDTTVLVPIKEWEKLQDIKDNIQRKIREELNNIEKEFTKKNEELIEKILSKDFSMYMMAIKDYAGVDRYIFQLKPTTDKVPDIANKDLITIYSKANTPEITSPFAGSKLGILWNKLTK